MPLRNDIARILTLLAPLALPGVLSGQTNDATELAKLEHPPAPRCHSVQLLSENGSPVTSTNVDISVLRTHFKKPHVSVVMVEFKSVKTTKTDLHGEFKLPNLSPGSYQLKLNRTQKHAFGAFEIPSEWQPQNCTQPWMLEDKGEYIDIHPALSSATSNEGKP